MTVRSCRIYLVLAAVILLTAPLSAQQNGATLLVTYQVAPADRPALWAYAQGPWLDRLDTWRKEGVFQAHRLLINSYVDDYTWDAMLVLRFDDYKNLDRWKEIEKRMPAGLDARGLQLVTPDHSYLTNVRFRNQSAEANPTAPVYFVIPYDFTSEAEYVRYAQTYVLPQFDGWIREGILHGYEILLNRHPTGKPWDVLFLLEYRDTASFGQRDDVKWGVRATLQENPAWKLVSDNKHDFRTEAETVIAEPVRRTR